MICSSENRFFTSNLRRLRDWTPNQFATQMREDVTPTMPDKAATATKDGSMDIEIVALLGLLFGALVGAGPRNAAYWW